MNLWNRSKSIMGTKNDKQTAAGAQFSEALLRRLMPLGAVTVKKMFGGFGIFQKGKMFGLVSSDAELFLKVDASNTFGSGLAPSPSCLRSRVRILV